MHNHWVTIAGEKMSKSLGNVLSVPEIVKLVRPVELRYYLGSAHYRSVLEYSPDALQEAAQGYRRIETFVEKVDDLPGQPPVPVGEWTDAFAEAMNDDIGVPRALAEIHNTVRAGNSALAMRDYGEARRMAARVRAMTEVLGFDPLSDQWQDGESVRFDAPMVALDALVQEELDRREIARSVKDWETADAVRDRLLEVGIIVTDTPEGPTWSWVP